MKQPSDQAAWQVCANHRYHTERAAALALTAACAASDVVQHRMFAPTVMLKTQHMRGAGRYAPAATGAARGIDLRQQHASAGRRVRCGQDLQHRLRRTADPHAQGRDDDRALHQNGVLSELLHCGL
jgi:hypothetical protein